MAAVSGKTKQAGEAQDQWSWAEATVWTERMLTALEKGVKGGKWFSLIDKVHARRNLDAAFRKVKSNRGGAGVDHVTIQMFEARLDANLSRLSDDIRSERYRPQRIKRVEIPKSGTKETRPLGIPTVRDRVVQTALRNVLEPIFERDFAEQSYGFRPQRGCKDALRRVDELLKRGYVYVVDADLQGYFDSIPKQPLLERVNQKVTDGRVLELLRLFLNQEILSGTKAWTPEAGTPQGAVISPLLSNIYLDPLDHRMEKAGWKMVRYADDFVVMCHTKEEAEAALAEVREWTAQAGLTLHPVKTHIAHAVNEGFEFLGYRFANNELWPRDKSLRSLKEAIRTKTKRNNPKSLEMTIVRVNRILRGWFEYFKHCKWYIFERLDRWIRMRLRAILWKRKGKGGFPKGMPNVKWPNAFFAKRGLFFLLEAHTEACQSAQRRTTDWRAVSGKTRRAVRKGGRPG